MLATGLGGYAPTRAAQNPCPRRWRLSVTVTARSSSLLVSLSSSTGQCRLARGAGTTCEQLGESIRAFEVWNSRFRHPARNPGIFSNQGCSCRWFQTHVETALEGPFRSCFLGMHPRQDSWNLGNCPHGGQFLGVCSARMRKLGMVEASGGTDGDRLNAYPRLYPSGDNFETFSWPSRDEIESLLVETH